MRVTHFHSLMIIMWTWIIIIVIVIAIYSLMVSRPLITEDCDTATVQTDTDEETLTIIVCKNNTTTSDERNGLPDTIFYISFTMSCVFDWPSQEGSV